MKELHTDANFPRTSDGRVYHLGLKPGEVANRIIAVGSSSRALIVANHLDAQPPPFKLSSERGFITITGRYKGVPVSVVCTGMGAPNTDFFVREVRECLSGDMLVVRLGSCGALLDIPPGSIVVPKACIAINRNWDYDFLSDQNTEKAYIITKPVAADPELYEAIYNSLEVARPNGSQTKIINNIVNASADSFYSSQGRQTSFPDHNEYLIPHLLETFKDLGSFEMETFHLYHLARNYVPRSPPLAPTSTQPTPLATSAVSPSLNTPHSSSSQTGIPSQPMSPPPKIRAAAAQMIFAARLSKGFITPDEVTALEEWTSLGILEALIGLALPADRIHDEPGSVWELK